MFHALSLTTHGAHISILAPLSLEPGQTLPLMIRLSSRIWYLCLWSRRKAEVQPSPQAETFQYNRWYWGSFSLHGIGLSLTHELVSTEINNYSTTVFHRAKLISKNCINITVDDLPKFLLFFPLSLPMNKENIATKKLLIYLFFKCLLVWMHLTGDC